MDETVDEYLVTHVTPVCDDAAGNVPTANDATCESDKVTGRPPEEGDVTGHVFEEDGVGKSREQELTVADAANGEDVEVEKKVKWQGSEGC